MSKALLVILDGFGLARDPEVSAIDHANKPFIDHLFKTYPHSQLIASGEKVGLPEGQFGNSEVGHLNIGAGRIVWQDITRIDTAIRDKSFFENDTLVEAVEKAKEKGRIHIMGLFSDGGVHSHNRHLFALLRLCKQHGLDDVYVHAFTDGRDTDPHAGVHYVKEFEEEASEIGTGEIASVVGRYYAMDRDNRWERVSQAYNLLVHGEGDVYDNATEALKSNYDNDVTDEFIKASRIKTEKDSRIGKDDVVIFYNYRGDRARQITRALTEDNFNEFDVVPDLNLHYVCFTQYDINFKNVKLAFDPISLKNVIGEVVSDNGLHQLRIAETEKYPHVTYFFNGGVEAPFANEDRILVPSPKVATYDLQPEMSAPKVAEKLVEQLKTEKYGFVVLNFANPDMVGHTGSMEAAIKAVETVDNELRKVVNTAIEHDYKIIIIADHGNADCMSNPDGSPNTAHTTAPVPFILVNVDGVKKLENGILADVSPSLLKLMEIDQPEEMTGHPLF
jgi:2,3-bisphosphoglycerate-independent phosphoglycerate mutase